jgi:molybdopterin-guanine dinucleotide biosynthesis protein A
MLRDPRTVSGAVLAGGSGSRVRHDKALLTLNGTSFLERSIRILQPAVSRLVVAAGKANRYALQGVEAIEDPIPACGPLGGILAALEESTADAVFVLACDLPFVTTDLIRFLIEAEPRRAIVVPSSEGDVQPLCGRYAVSLKGALREFLQHGGRKVRDFVASRQNTVIDIAPGHLMYRPHLLSNVNSDKELRSAEAFMKMEKK